MINKMILLTILVFFSTNVFGSLSFSPSPSSGAISLNEYAQTLLISNNGSTNESMNLSINQSGLFKMVDRCSGKILKPKKSCYLLITVDPKQSTFSSQLENNSSPILTLNFTKTQSLTESLSLSTSSLNFGTIKSFGYSGSKQIIITNTGTSVLNPVFEPTANVKLLANRCLEIRRGASCSIFVVVDANASLGYSGSISGQSLSVKPSASGSAQVVSISGTMNVYTACSPTQHINGLSCDDNVVTCSDINLGVLSGSQTWNPLSSSYGSCLASSVNDCFAGYSYNSGSCSLINASILEKQYLPSESLLAIPSQTMFYNNNGNFGRFLAKFTLTQKSYVNSLELKVNSMSGMGFGIANANNPSEISLDGHVMLRLFDNYQSGSGIKTFSYNDAGLLLDPGNYYVMDMTGYLGGSYTIPLYYSPPNVSFSVYGRECDFGYGSCVYSGGVYVPFSTPPQNYAPHFKVNTTPFVEPLAFSPTLKSSSLTLSNGNKTMSGSSAPVVSWGYINKYIETSSNGKFYIEFKFTSPYYSYVGGNFLNSDPSIFYNGGWPFALSAGYSGIYAHEGTPSLYLNSSGTTIPGITWGNNSVVMLAIDLVNNKAWQGVNGVWGSGDPATNVGGLNISGARGSLTRFYFSVALSNGSVEVLTPFQYTPPTGFIAPP